MDSDHARDHEHELEAEYLSASDATVLEIYSSDGSLVVDLIVPCPTCSDPLQVSARVEAVSEAELDVPLDDAEDPYD